MYGMWRSSPAVLQTIETCIKGRHVRPHAVLTCVDKITLNRAA